MARPLKKGLDYFPFDVGFWADDNKIRILKSRYKADGIAVYIHILCDIYREGYYLEVDNLEDYYFLLADDIGTTSDKVEQILTFICNREILVCLENTDPSNELHKNAVFTSHGIQKRYCEAMKSRKKSVAEMKGEYWLLSESDEAELDTFYKSTKNGSFSENNPHKSENNPHKSENNPTNKIKLNKTKTNDINNNHQQRAGAQETNDPFLSELLQLYPKIRADADSSKLSEIDFNSIITKFEESTYLRETADSLDWLVRNYPLILRGKYKDRPKVAATGAPTLDENGDTPEQAARRREFRETYGDLGR